MTKAFQRLSPPPGGHWFGRLKDEYVYNPELKCFTAVGDEAWNELHGPLSKGLQEATAMRAGHDYVHRRLVS